MKTRLISRFLTAVSTILLWQVACAMPAMAAEADTGAAQPTGTPQAMATMPEPTDNESRPIADGSQTRYWLKQQGDRTQASAKRQTLSGPVMNAVHERYVRSFTSPIPERIAVQGASR